MNISEAVLPKPVTSCAFPRWAGVVCALTVALALSSCSLGKSESSGASADATTTSAAATDVPTDATEASESSVVTTVPAADQTTVAGTPAAGEPSTYPASGWVNADSVHIRPTPDTSQFAIGGAKMGEKFTVLGKQGDWYQIRFKDGTAYINAQFMQFTEVLADVTDAPAVTAAP